MLDTKKVGVKIVLLRKKIGLSQEKLAEILCISPQAISKWENGHTLPETSLLPILSQIFECSIDEIIMPAYSFDEKIEEVRPTLLEQQAEHIAKHLIQNLEGKMMQKEIIGLDDNTIINSIYKVHPNIGNCKVFREKPFKTDGDLNTCITITAPQKEFKVIEKIIFRYDIELHRYHFFNKKIAMIPYVYYTDFDRKIILLEDLNNDYIQGFNFNEENKYGEMIRRNYNGILNAAADLHSAFWENEEAFAQIGLDWRLESAENLLTHISGMENDFKKYRMNEESGKIPKVGVVSCQNNIEKKQLDYFSYAIDYLREEYVKLIDTRFHAGKNITIIHGDMHPGTTFMSKKEDRTVKFVNLQAVRMGLCTEDLAMLLALHIEPDKRHAKSLLDHYYNRLCEKVKGYSYETFMSDYKISIMENMFFAIRLINQGIYDFFMRDRAIKAFETFVLEME